MKKTVIFILVVFLLFGAVSCGLVSDLIDASNREELSAASPDGTTMTVVFIDVGQGDSALVISPSGKTMLIDAGEYEAYGDVVSTLAQYGITHIDYVVASHPHSDHIGCMNLIIDNYSIGEVFMPDVAHTSKTFEKLVDSVLEKELSATVAKAGVTIDFGDGVTCIMFSPVQEEYEDLNDYSPIMRISYADASFMFTGDAGVLPESEVVKANRNLRADVLKLGHHGSSTATSEEFLRAVNPQYAVISLGEDNSYGHPHEEVMALLEKNAVPYCRTDEMGNIVFTTDGNGVMLANGDATHTGGADAAEVSTSTSSEEVQAFVYKTPSGKSYHKEGCSYLNENAEQVTLAQAQKLGLKPCSRCYS